MHLSCLEIARWVTVEAQSRADRHRAVVREVVRRQAQGRVHINILPAYGAPYLTKDDVVRMAFYYFKDPQPPYRPKVKINGVEVEDMSSYEWSLYVAGPKANYWPTYLDHPDRLRDMYFEYQIQSNVTRKHKLCLFCHKPRPPCLGHGNWCKVLRERQEREERVRAHNATRRHGALTMESIASHDPIVEQYMLRGPPPPRHWRWP